jgi:hypothetical protein
MKNLQIYEKQQIKPQKKTLENIRNLCKFDES